MMLFCDRFDAIYSALKFIETLHMVSLSTKTNTNRFIHHHTLAIVLAPRMCAVSSVFYVTLYAIVIGQGI